MSVEAVDRMLEEWEERLRRVDESLLALETEPTYEMLAPRAAARAPLEGETKQLVAPALDALGELFEHRGRLTDALDRAKELRASMTGLIAWGNDDKEREIQALLYGPSIELPPDLTPLARRTLLDPGRREVRIVPGQLLEAMAAAYEKARDVILAVQRAWEETEPALATLEARVRDARQSARSLELEAGVADELAAIEQALERVRIRVARDPLGAAKDLGGSLTPRLSVLSARLAEEATLRQKVQDGLAQAAKLSRELEAVHRAAAEAVRRIPLEVEGAHAPGAPLDDGLVRGLGPWLDRIAEAARAQRWRPAEVGLARWREAAEGYLKSDGEIAKALTALLARRDELKGRLAARRAQASSFADRAAHAGGAAPVDTQAEALAREAEDLLARRPTPLARASDLVERYDQAVRQSRTR
jgi:hypothetical protein